MFRSRVANPRWIGSMMRHGYKGAFELSRDGRLPVRLRRDDRRRRGLDVRGRSPQRYVGEEDVRDFLTRSNPWALRAIAERLLEAADRGLWAAPEDGSLELLREAYLDVEGDLEEAST